MKAVHTISGLVSMSAGPSYSVPRLCEAIKNKGADVRLYSRGMGKNTSKNDRPAYLIETVPDYEIIKILNRLGLTEEMRRLLAGAESDIFHTHGLWMMPNIYPAEAARRLGRPFVLAPRGMLGQEALKFSRAAKFVFWTLWQKRAVESVSCFHATAPSEYEDIRAFGLRQPVAIVPNGIDLPDLTDLGPDGNAPRPASPYVLSLGRIHPKKGLDRLVAAWALVADEFPRWRLRIVGPDEGGHAGQLKRLISAAGMSESVTVEGAAFGREKIKLMRDAEIFALATLNENFAMTVAESLACETPVISTRGAPWSGLVDNRCGWWIDHGPEAMAAALREAMAMPDNERRAMGRRGRAWMQRDFGWDGIGERMIGVYSWLLSGADRPGWVWTD